MSILQEVETVDVHHKWADEARDFTPWLARNLDLLGREIGLKLELVETEKAIHSLKLDILAKDTDTGAMVAIENQLYETDIGHLGQLLTYTAGCDAKVAIWVAPDFRYKYANALHQLNQWTGDKIGFYGVKVEAVKKRYGSGLGARFRKVVWPGGWNKELTHRPGPGLSPDAQKHHDFFQPLVKDVFLQDFVDKAIQRFDHTGRYFPSRLNPCAWYAVSLEKNNSAWVSLHIEAGSREETKRIFDRLRDHRDQIEDEFDAYPKAEWHWYRHDNYGFSSINIRRDGAIYDPPDKLEETRAWMLDMLRKMKEIFDRRVEQLLK